MVHGMADTGNLAERVRRIAEQTPDAVALWYEETEISYGQLWESIGKWARQFRLWGVQPGDRIGLLRYNDPGFVAAYFATLGMGAVVVPLNTRLTASELTVILKDAGVTWLVSDDAFAEVLSQLQTEQSLTLVFEQPLSEELSALLSDRFTLTLQELIDSSVLEHFPVTVSAETLGVLIYTSGTTGVPKGVMLSQANILADAEANVSVIEAVSDDRFITISPLFHVFGQTNILITAVVVGAGVVLIPKFSPKRVLKAISDYRVTFMAAVPTMYQMMLACIKEDVYNLSSLRVCHSGAAPLLVEVFKEIEAVFGAPVQEGYGLSEASSIVTSNPLHGIRKPGSIGYGLPGITVKVLDEHLNELPDGEVGEIHVKGPVVMQGYYGRPEATRKVLVEGWLKTGDMAYRDTQGYLFIVDRKDDMMNVGGVNVYPREIEEVLYRHPAVSWAVVVGRPSFLYNQEVKAYIVLKEGCKATAKALKTFCEKDLAPYKIPSKFHFVNEIPRGATGKILRKELP